MADNQGAIERRLFTTRRGDRKPTLFLYDVTSSYLEGQCNALAAFGYNRDGKAGKKQVVIGLLCDEEGTPVSVDVFAGNTPDMTTLAAQITKVARRFGCDRVTFVGDRGMIKSRQIADLARAGFHYITALTKPQVERLLKDTVLQLALFTAQVCEVEHKDIRYIVRRNPLRAEEVAAVRCDKQRTWSSGWPRKTRIWPPIPVPRPPSLCGSATPNSSACKSTRGSRGSRGAHVMLTGACGSATRGREAGRLLCAQD